MSQLVPGLDNETVFVMSDRIEQIMRGLTEEEAHEAFLYFSTMLEGEWREKR